MAVYGILADVHGNIEALGAVLAALDGRRIDRLVCLGDIVGYNADSNACVEIVRSRGIESIAGNHDLISIGRLGTDRCSNPAALALERTRRRLNAASREFLGALPEIRLYEDHILLLHGGLGDTQEYMRGEQQIRENALRVRERHPAVRICIFAHTHNQKLYEVRSGTVRECPVGSSCPLDGAGLYFINPGSIDASRKQGAKRGEFGVFDSEAWRMEFHGVPYDAATTEAKAVRDGYRIGPLADWLRTTRRRIRSKLG